MRVLRSISLLAAGTVLGIIATVSTTNSADYEPMPLPKPPKIVTKTVEKNALVYPKACTSIPAVAADLIKAVEDYEAVMGRESRVQDESYQAMNGGDQAALNDAITDHRAIIADTLDASLRVTEARQKLARIQSDCDEYRAQFPPE